MRGVGSGSNGGRSDGSVQIVIMNSGNTAGGRGV